ncbi:uncharacterized protein isoform X11 [Danio rerio]|uniref:Uncharacterized protein isoform X11 n=1 Tax=Danio rerio TaxID=7955 RepID=A0AC58IF28_DANRE
MTKLQLLHRALNERLMAAVEQIMEMVGGTVLEYEEETIRVRKENEVLRRRLRWLEGATSADWPGPSEPVMTSIPEDSNPSQQDENTVNCGFEENSGPVVIKTELTDHPLHVRPESADQGSENAGTSTGIAFGLTGSMTWDSAQNYMAPLDFDPSSGISRFRDWRERNRRQRMSFACLDCGKVFGREQGLIFHMRIHSKDRPYMYRQRKACFYGDKRKKRKLHRLSQLTREVGLSREAEDDLSDGSEQTNRSSASPDRLAPGQEDEGLSESDCSSSGKEAKKLPLRRRRPGRTKRTQPCVPCYCPHCPGRVFSGPGQLGMHMKSHRAPQNQGSPTQSSTNKTEEATRTNIPQVSFLPNRCFSKVWDYFIKDAFGEVFCRECSARVSQGSSKAANKNTSNLWSHLRIKHQHAYVEAKGYRPVNMRIDTLDTVPIKLEKLEPEECIIQSGSQINEVLITEIPSNENL